MGVYIKLNPIKEIVKGKNVVLIDDSIVRGTTCKKIVKLIRDSGAKEIHLRISSPPIKFPCFYGIDTPTQKELIAANYEIDKIREFLEVDSLRYLTIEDLLEVVGNKSDNFCVACFNGEYPIR
jgi:amidophosphoribosyltransferase